MKKKCYFIKSEQWLWWLSLLVLLFLAGRVLYFLVTYGSIYPHWDEWKYVPVKGGVLRHLFDFNNENLQFFTNLQFALVEYLRLPFKANVIISYMIYLGMLGVCYNFLKQYVKDNSRWGLLLCFVPMFSDYMADVLFWAVLSQTWFYLLFMILAVSYGFSKPQTNHNRAMALLMICCSVLAMNVSFIILFLAVYVIKNLYNAQSVENRYSELLYGGIELVGLMIILFIYFFFMMQVDKATIEWKFLLTSSYYQHLGYFIISPMFGFFMKPDEGTKNVIVAGVIILWLLFLFLRQMKDTKMQGLWALLLILGGNAAAITLFRGDFVYAIADHSGRYLPFVLLLFPAIYCVGLNDVKKRVQYVHCGLIVLMFITSSVGLFSGRYKVSILRIEGGDACINRYYQMKERPIAYYCANRYWNNLVPYLEDFERAFLK